MKQIHRALAVTLALVGGVWPSWSCFAADGAASRIPDGKQVLALQAFLPKEQSAAIASLCMRVGKIAGARVAFAQGAVPHVTLSAWRVTADEREQSIVALQGLRTSELEPVEIRCRIEKRAGSGTVAWYLVPEESARPDLDVFRQRVLRALNFGYEDFQGRSREAWWPHLTLFSLPAAGAADADAILAELARFDHIRLSAVALVGFQSGIHTLVERSID